MQTDTRPKPEPLHIRKERQAAEGEAAWQQYRAEEAAVNKNMERLRAQRLAREAAAESAAAPERRSARQRAPSRVRTARHKIRLTVRKANAAAPRP